jgi:hypothetical protein
MVFGGLLVFAIVIARLSSAGLMTVKVAALAIADIARNKTGSAIAANATRRFRPAIRPLPATHPAALANFGY